MAIAAGALDTFGGITLISSLDVDILPPGQSWVSSHRSPSCEGSSSVFVSADLSSPPSQALQPKRGLGWRRNSPRFLASTFSPFPRSRPTSFLCLRVHPDFYFLALFFFFFASLLALLLLLPLIFLSIPCFVVVDRRSLCLLFLQ